MITVEKRATFPLLVYGATSVEIIENQDFIDTQTRIYGSFKLSFLEGF
jgi:hypothetical protein